MLPALKVLDISHSPLTRIDLAAPNLKRLFNRSEVLPANFTLKCGNLEVLAVNHLSIAKALHFRENLTRDLLYSPGPDDYTPSRSNQSQPC